MRSEHWDGTGSWKPHCSDVIMGKCIGYSLGHAYHVVKFLAEFCWKLFWHFIFSKCTMCFRGETFWGMLVWLTWNEGCESVGYWVNYVTLTFDLTHDLDLEFFNVKIWNSSISDIDGPIGVKQKGANQLDTGQLCDLSLWSHPWPWSWIFQVNIRNNLISVMGVPINMERKWSELIIHDHDSDLCVTISGGWVYQILKEVIVRGGQHVNT